MRAHLSELMLAALAAVVLVTAVTVGGALSLVAGISAAAFALSLRSLSVSFLASLEPRSRNEKRAAQRIEQDIRRRMGELHVQNQQDARAGGGR